LWDAAKVTILDPANPKHAELHHLQEAEKAQKRARELFGKGKAMADRASSLVRGAKEARAKLAALRKEAFISRQMAVPALKDAREYNRQGKRLERKSEREFAKAARAHVRAMKSKNR
jgi:hypothetical protein